jgi:hypothetical protein
MTMGLRRREPDIKPYRGMIEWDSVSRQWIITVRGWEGAPLFYLSASDVFHAEVLQAHLLMADLTPGGVTFERQDECRVSIRSSPDLAKVAGKLLKILREHYSHFKGRPIHWVRRPGRPR